MSEPDSIAGFSRNMVINALERNLWDLWCHFGRGPGCNLYDEGDVIWFDTPIATLPYNAVLKFTVEDNIEPRIDNIIEHYKRRGVPFLWFVHPSSRPADLEDRLGKRGLKEVEIVPGMAADLDDLPEAGQLPDDIEVREVIGKSDTDCWYEIVAWRWEVPSETRSFLKSLNQEFQIGTPEAKIRCWLAWRGGTPIAKAVLNISEGAAGLYGVATKPEARKLGLGRQLTLEALWAGRTAGCRLGVLHSSPMAQNLYSKIGFHTIEPFRLFASGSLNI
jgi:ribosomal protein S18 acetylase RimI-like enzyme